MQHNFKRAPGFLFLLLLLADVVTLTGSAMLHPLLKALLMPALIILLWTNTSASENKYRLPVLLGLVFSWAGDIFLLFDQKDPIFFIAGLSAFLITHLCYIFFFRKLAFPEKGWLPQNRFITLTIITYGILLVAGLWNWLGDLKVPVVIYAACISLMVLLSLRVQPLLPGKIWGPLAVGAFLFFISDSILAINKFVSQSLFAPSFIMLTYGLAQYFIVLGTLRFCQAIGNVNQGPAE